MIVNERPKDAWSPGLLAGDPPPPGAPHRVGGLSFSPRISRAEFPSLDGFERAVKFKGAYDHFALRAAERLPPGIEVPVLWSALIKAIETDATHFVRFVCAAAAKYRQVYRFRLLDQSTFYLVWDHRRRVPITILEPGYRLTRKNGRKRLTLKDN